MVLISDWEVLILFSMAVACTWYSPKS